MGGREERKRPFRFLPLPPLKKLPKEERDSVQEDPIRRERNAQDRPSRWAAKGTKEEENIMDLGS